MTKCLRTQNWGLIRRAKYADESFAINPHHVRAISRIYIQQTEIVKIILETQKDTMPYEIYDAKNVVDGATLSMHLDRYI